MDVVYKDLLVFASVVMAGVCGFSIWSVFRRFLDRKRNIKSMNEMIGANGAAGFSDDALQNEEKGFLEVKVIGFLKYESKRMELSEEKPKSLPAIFTGKADVSKQLKLSGLNGQINDRGFYEARIKLALSFMCLGAIVGFLISLPLGFVLALAGVLTGWMLPSWAIKSQKQWRVRQMERHLPEMLDVLSLGMRSGLSFDAALQLYSSHFKTVLSHEFSNAQRRWSAGLEKRDEALRKIADTYDSSIFGRVVETIIRSVRFGSSMVDSLEAQGAEARAAYKARREEQVAKAPVKMMIPTGTLILPAMLILVLGPVMLELIGGGF